MSTTNLFTAAERVYSEFDAFSASRHREHGLPESMVQALESLASVLYSPEGCNQKTSQANPMVDINESELDKIVSRANAAFFDTRSLAMAAEGLLFKSAHGESDDDVVAARTVLDLLAAQALAMASEMDIVGIRQRRKAA